MSWNSIILPVLEGVEQESVVCDWSQWINEKVWLCLKRNSQHISERTKKLDLESKRSDVFLQWKWKWSLLGRKKRWKMIGWKRQTTNRLSLRRVWARGRREEGNSLWKTMEGKKAAAALSDIGDVLTAKRRATSGAEGFRRQKTPFLPRHPSR